MQQIRDVVQGPPMLDLHDLPAETLSGSNELHVLASYTVTADRLYIPMVCPEQLHLLSLSLRSFLCCTAIRA